MKCCTYRPDVPLPLPNGTLELAPDAVNEKGEDDYAPLLSAGEPVPKMGEAIHITSEADISDYWWYLSLTYTPQLGL